MGMPPCGGIVVFVIMVRMPVVMIAMRIMARFGGMGVIAVIAMFVCMIVVMPMIMPVVVIMSVITMRRTGRRHRGPERCDRTAELTQGGKESAALQEEQRHAEHLDKKIA